MIGAGIPETAASADRPHVRRQVRLLAPHRFRALAVDVAAALRTGDTDDDHPADAGETWRTTVACLRVGMLALVEPGRVGAIAADLSRRIGVHAARRRRPLDTVLAAYRTGGTMLWQAVVDAATEDHAEGIGALLRVSPFWWHFLQQQSAIIADAYRMASGEPMSRQAERMRLAFDALVSRLMPPSDIPAAAAVLDLPIRGRYAVVVVGGGDAGTRKHAWSAFHAAAHVKAVWRARTADDIAAVFLGSETPDRLAEGLRPAGGAYAGVSRAVDGLAALPDALHLAEAAARTCTKPGEVAVFDARLPAALLACRPDVAATLAALVLGPVLELDATERDLILTTFSVWLASEGSTYATGRRLFCHRNTVLNRLRRLERLTGRRLADPRDVADLKLALDAHHLA